MIIQLMRGVSAFQNTLTDEIHFIYDQLSQQGQNPDTCLITCADSRVMPELLTQGKPGELFTLRNVGNMIPHFHPLPQKDSAQESLAPIAPSSAELAGLEFALEGLGVKNIIICGHSDCGAMKVLLSPSETLTHVNHWVYSQAHFPDYTVHLTRKPDDSELTFVTQRNVLIQLEKLKTYPIVQQKLAHDDLALHAWYFDFQHKKVFVYEPSCEQFVDLKTALDFATQARRKKIVFTSVINYLAQCPIPQDKEAYQARRTLLLQLETNALEPIWDDIRACVSDALWQELIGLYPHQDDTAFNQFVDEAKTMTLEPHHIKHLLSSLTTSRGYYDYCYGNSFLLTNTPRRAHSPALQSPEEQHQQQVARPSI